MNRSDRPRVAVLGAGSWGTALALVLSRNGIETPLWGLPEEIALLQRERENRRYLPGIPFPETLHPTADLGAAVTHSSDLLIAVPSGAFPTLLAQLHPLLSSSAPIAWATKGLAPDHGGLLSTLIEQTLGPRTLAVLSGPTFANEVACGLPTAITVAANAPEYATRFAQYLHNDTFRAYTASDLIGVQIGGSAKNVMAIGAGIADGLGFGANARAALITRGLVEIIRLGVAMGGSRETFMGLAGIGDLVLTCTDNQSRNRRMGLALAAGNTIEQARAQIGQAVEGVTTAQAIHRLAQQHAVEMPITEQIYRVLFQGLHPREAVNQLLERAQKAERL